ncbi:hypothetical protein FDECE_18469, partial [Fusarium decemcellulare]
MEPPPVSPTNPDTAKSLKSRANEQLAQRFHPGRVGDYDEVHVLLLRWQECDLKRLEEEQDKLVELFQDKFHFKVERFSIPMQDSDLELEQRLIQLK